MPHTPARPGLEKRGTRCQGYAKAGNILEQTSYVLVRYIVAKGSERTYETSRCQSLLTFALLLYMQPVIVLKPLGTRRGARCQHAKLGTGSSTANAEVLT